MGWAIEAIPKSAEDLGCTTSCPEVVHAASERAISSIVHFTRTTGLKGILHSSALKARRYLPEDYRVRHVYRPNAPDRMRDWCWHGYANLSVTDINRDLFGRSRRWDSEADWVIIRFDPVILGDPGVVFCTTNNAYPNVHRGEGLPGFNQMFAPEVQWGHYGSVSTRRNRSPSQTTNPQAEILYPLELSLEHIQAVVVEDESVLETAQGILTHFSAHQPTVVLDPEAF
jgi:hypothetical protein